MKKRTMQMAADLLLIIVLLMLMNGQSLGELPHEILGVAFFALFLVHQYLNFSWWKNIGRGKYSAVRILQTILNISLLADILLMMGSGIAISRALFVGLPVIFDKNTGRTLHLLGAYWGFIAMSMHVGLHFSGMKEQLGKKIPLFRTKAAAVIYLIVSVFGIYSFFHEFHSLLLRLLGYLAILILCGGIGYYLKRSLQKKKKVSAAGIFAGGALAIIVACAGIVGYAMMDRPNTSAANTLLKVSEDNKTLVAYFSRAAVTADRDNIDASAHASIEPGIPKLGRMEKVADMVQRATGADIYEIVTASYYPTNYELTTVKALIEKMRDMRPELVNLPDSLEQYDTIYVGYPAWWGTPPMAIATFLENYDLSGKTIVPFMISIDTKAEEGYSVLKEWAGEATVLEPFEANQESDEKISQWIADGLF